MRVSEKVIWTRVVDVVTLREGLCMFAVHDDCDPAVCVVGLRGDWDTDAVLVCRRHLSHLRRLRPYEAERLARYLRVTFASQHTSAAA